ncbi:uncharacterized protein DDB_G0271670-like [Zingiber officinale]|uniref:uncharacterized protein DDB_G0271670-like n=1 Tax=Zingiber officinale TaxID=94328 RepID=UPI001C4C8B8F|nr:uncharacterized protein DDB_G0271670-like [Zingiber officinale]
MTERLASPAFTADNPLPLPPAFLLFLSFLFDSIPFQFFAFTLRFSPLFPLRFRTFFLPYFSQRPQGGKNLEIGSLITAPGGTYQWRRTGSSKSRMGFRRMVTTVPVVSDEGTAGNLRASRLRLQKKTPNPSPSPRSRDPSISSRPPLSSCEKGNAAAPKIPRGKDINSRYLVTSSPSSFSASDFKGGSLSSASTTSSSKGASFTSSSCSASIASSSSSSTSTATSSRRSFCSNVPASRPSSPMAMPPTSLSNRSKSVDRNRPTETSTRCIARESAELSTAAARALRTTTRSLSVSFQGESFPYPTSKARLVSPSPIRKPTPERRTSIAPSFKSESFGPSENHHRWDAARTQQYISLTRSLNCSVPDNDSVLATIRSLRQSMVLDEGARRASFDGGDFSLPFHTDILSSGGNSEPFELNARSPRIAATTCGRDVPARFLLEEGKLKPSPGGKCKTSSKPPVSSINGLLPSPLISSSPRPCSFGPSYLSKLAVPFSCNAASMFGMGADIKRGKYVERQLEDAHRLRLLNNRHLRLMHK